jgi:hypothetical protein
MRNKSVTPNLKIGWTFSQGDYPDLNSDYESARNSPWTGVNDPPACDCSDVDKHPILKRAGGVLFVAIALAFAFFQFAHDIRMSLFIFLVTAFAGSMFSMITVVTKEG